MSDRKLAKTVQQLFRDLQKLYRSLSKGFVTWLLRTALMMHRRRRAVAGFVLPTTVFLILVVALTAGALSYRAFNSSTRVIGNVQSRAIYNAATPAIDRARAKLDYLFGKDNRLPGGVPGEELMISILRNDAQVRLGPNPSDNPYLLQDEKQIDINDDGTLDAAWVYKDASTGSSIIYSINASTPDGDLKAFELLTMNDDTKAKGDIWGPYVRNGPLSNSKTVGCPGAGGKIEQGWYEDNNATAILRKRFQVNAFVVKDEDVGAGKPTNLTALEFMQDRKLDRGNKWGAWFQGDLEIHSGGAFNWNGAMHTEGSFIIGGNAFNGKTFTAYLISAPDSCVFQPKSNSEISVRTFQQDPTDPNTVVNKGQPFNGVIAVGKTTGDITQGEADIHDYNDSITDYEIPAPLNTTTQWKTGGKTPSQFGTDPVALLTEGIQKAKGGDVSNLTDAYQKQGTFPNRFDSNQRSSRPNLDDLYRADNRWGPKAQYSDKKPIIGKVGGDIPGDSKDLIGDPGVTPSDPVGLDGYWERRTFKDSDVTLGKDNYTGGLRILVGERLELGNPFGWVAPQDRPGSLPIDRQQPDQPPVAGDNDWDDLRTNSYVAANASNADPDASDNPGDPLNPPYKYADPARAHEAKQRRALRDNLAAVQASAIYHYKLGEGKNGKYPAACLITTAHPGSPTTLTQSVNFTALATAQGIKGRDGNNIDTRFDFFSGKGTNGWEFSPPSESSLKSGPMRIALENLAKFAGDYDPVTKKGGAFPPTQENNRIHPDPNLTMWGNFSNLRRALATDYDALSPADKSYLHTAACTLGALGYNVNQIENFDPSNAALAADLKNLATELREYMDGDVSDGKEVLSQSQLATYDQTSGDNNYDGSLATANMSQYNPRDYDRVTPDMFLAAFKAYEEQIAGTELEKIPYKYKLYQLGLLIHESFQIRRDRIFGFRPSPAANTWNYNPFMLELPFGINKPTLWSSACDPNIFNLSNTAPGQTGAGSLYLTKTAPGANSREALNRLALSRLCGTVIPSGSVHDFPGDYNYPARATNNPPDVPSPPSGIPTGMQYLPNLNATPNADGIQLRAVPDQPVDPVTNPVVVTSAPAYLKPISDTNNAKFADVTLAPTNLLNDPGNVAEVNRRALVAPKFPSLYYVFPEFAHDRDGDIATSLTPDNRQPGNSLLNALPAALQPWQEPYITQALANGDNPNFSVVPSTLTPIAKDQDYTVNYLASQLPNLLPSKPIAVKSFQYKAFSALPVDSTPVDLGVTPRNSLTDWVLPHENTTSNPPPPNLIRIGDINNPSVVPVPFLDRVIFNGREWQPSRVLDVDLEMLRTTSLPDAENWLPVSGIVYAFREDAVREDGIARPASGGITNTKIPGAATEKDPAVAEKTGISPKPIDAVADPDRRVHGFRLRRGDVLKRGNPDIPLDKNIRGISFITDNLVYIMGNFNRHQASRDGARMEEFAELPLNPSGYSPEVFYKDRNKDNKNNNFSDKNADLWRPTEVLADSITLLSDTFCDGSAIDTFMTAGEETNSSSGGIDGNTSSGSSDRKDVYKAGADGGAGAGVYNNQNKALFGPGCSSGQATSFLNQNRPKRDLASNFNWERENPLDPIYSPVKISRNGNGLIVRGSSGPKSLVPVEYSSSNDPNQSAQDYISEADDGDEDRSRPLQRANGGNASGTTVNSILVNGIIPSRLNQPYGGLHNFPRFLEDWTNIPLRFAGSFLQLNFTNYATAPYDQDLWEPPTLDATIAPAASTDEMTDYYAPPIRAWGYDVGLQLAPASPAAARFTTPSADRNEFYNEPAANDPYIQKLCNALKKNPPGANLNSLNCPA